VEISSFPKTSFFYFQCIDGQCLLIAQARCIPSQHFMVSPQNLIFPETLRFHRKFLKTAKKMYTHKTILVLPIIVHCFFKKKCNSSINMFSKSVRCLLLKSMSSSYVPVPLFFFSSFCLFFCFCLHIIYSVRWPASLVE